MGTEEFWIPAVLAAVSTGASYANQKSAANRQDQGEAQAIRDQQALQEKATAQATSLTKQIAQNSPQQIAGKETGDFVQQLRRNAAGSTQGGSTTGGTQAGGSVSALAPVAGGSARYNADKGQSQKDVQDYGNTYAGEMGQIDAAVRQRQNEGLAMESLGTNLNLEGAQSASTNFVDQLRAQAAGVANPWVSLFSSILGNGAKAYAMNATPGSKVPASARIGANGYTLAGTPVDAGNFGYMPAGPTPA